MLRYSFLLFIFLFNQANGLAQTRDYKPIADEASFRKRFAEEAKMILTVNSEFVQEKNISVLSEKIISKGNFSFKKQNRVRMEYHTPVRHLMIINKDKITIKNDHSSNTYSTRSNKLFEYINKIMLDCIQGTAMNNKDFSTKIFENNEFYFLDLIPVKKDLKSFFTKINIYIDKKDLSVLKFDMIEPTGDNTLIVFNKRQINQPIPDEVFLAK